MKLPQARLLVVGGTRRLGRRLALDLAAHGASVCVTSRHEGEHLAAMLPELRTASAPTAAALAGDVASFAGAERLVGGAAETLGGLDGIVFAASGPFIPTPPDELSEESWDASFNTIAKGFFATARAARRCFLGQAAGDRALVCLTDYVGLHAWPSFTAHGAAKAAQLHLIEVLARAWAGDGMRILGVAPGPVDLDDDEHRDAALRMAAKAPIPRLIPASDVGRAVRFCLTTESATGINIPVDNGSLLVR